MSDQDAPTPRLSRYRRAKFATGYVSNNSPEIATGEEIRDDWRGKCPARRLLLNRQDATIFASIFSGAFELVQNDSPSTGMAVVSYFSINWARTIRRRCARAGEKRFERDDPPRPAVSNPRTGPSGRKTVLVLSGDASALVLLSGPGPVPPVLQRDSQAQENLVEDTPPRSPKQLFSLEHEVLSSVHDSH